MGHVVTPNGLSVTFLYIIPYIYTQPDIYYFFVVTLSELFQCQVFASSYLPNRNDTIGNCLWTLLGLYSVIMTALDEACDVTRHKKILIRKLMPSSISDALHEPALLLTRKIKEFAAVALSCAV